MAIVVDRVSPVPSEGKVCVLLLDIAGQVHWVIGVGIKVSAIVCNIYVVHFCILLSTQQVVYATPDREPAEQQFIYEVGSYTVQE